MRAIFVVGLALLCGSCIQGEPPVITAKPVALDDGTTVEPTSFSVDPDMRVIGFSTVQTTIPRGSVIGETSYRPLTCELGTKLYYGRDRRTIQPIAYNDIFHTIFSGYGYRVAGDPKALFREAGQETADFQAGANITKISGDLCQHAQTVDLSGKVTIMVNWQIYDSLRRRVVWQKDVEGRFEAPQRLTSDYDLFIQHAFADSANKVAADPSLRELLKQRPMREASAPIMPATSSTTRHIIPRQAQRGGTIDGHIDHLRSSTVLIDLGTSIGSGFLVREDGLVLTNQHVVQNQRFVNVRLVSGRSAVGEVLSRNEFRDVALVKIEGEGYPVVSIRETPVRVAEEVYAIGTPRDRMLSWTVTRGVVSAYRQGIGPQRLDFIQSDVAIHGGNSGGPLLDRQGNVVGIAVLGWASDPRNPAANTSLNGFIPILDGLAKLGLELVEPAEYRRQRVAGQ
jgi:S1-C subfamily serine protease